MGKAHRVKLLHSRSLGWPLKRWNLINSLVLWQAPCPLMEAVVFLYRLHVLQTAYSVCTTQILQFHMIHLVFQRTAIVENVEPNFEIRIICPLLTM